MRKFGKRILFCAVLAFAAWVGTLFADRQVLNQQLIRLHVVAASDSREDQTLKLKVRDAVTESLREDLAKMTDVDAALVYLEENLPKIQKIANQVLEAAGCDAEVVVSLCREAFDTCYYDTFSLPAGVYEALRIVIGEGRGHNWWCVAFPSLCLPATSDGFRAEAAGSGFSNRLTDTLTEENYEVRFFLLDCLGRLQARFSDLDR